MDIISDYEVAIIGAGAAGCSASIYAGRAGIKAVVLDREMGGGLAATAPKIENYPGFPSIGGMELTQKMLEHAKSYADFHLGEDVEKVEKNNEEFIITTSQAKYKVRAIVICTGTTYKKLNVPGEKELSGRGVSYCATCDGFFFKGKSVAVIGGGNTALLDAIYLKQIGCKEVFLIHRREVLRGEKILQREAQESGINIILNSRVKSINGKELVESITLEDTKKSTEREMKVNGVFVAVGEEPQNKIAKDLNLKLDKDGYIVTDKAQRASLKGVYAAGDITGGLRQIVTACAEGAVAALNTTEVLGKKYPY